MKFAKIAAVLFLVMAVFVGCNEGDDEGGDFEISLSGADEVCEDESACGGEGSGKAELEINSDRNEVCYEIELEGVENVSAAHIHAAPEGEAGDVVVDLEYDGDDGGADACVDDIDESVLEDISEEPERHYVNVHSEEFPDGAVRGQLGD